jgi:hypothetical protein
LCFVLSLMTITDALHVDAPVVLLTSLASLAPNSTKRSEERFRQNLER